MAETSIEWTDRVWNCLRGCSRVSRGCGDGAGGGCYAERMAHRFSGEGMPYEGLTRLTAGGPRWTGEVRTVPELLAEPLRWRKPQRVFVNSMSDLFHEDVPDKFIAAVFGVMAECPQHVFQILTKRPERARRWFAWLDGTIDPIVAQYAKDGMQQRPRGQWYAMQTMGWTDHYIGREVSERDEEDPPEIAWPLPNVWIGCSVEDQAAADSRVPDLMQTPAAVRFVSAEPLLGPVDLRHLYGHVKLGECVDLCVDALAGKHAAAWAGRGTIPDRPLPRGAGKLDWVIVGGESGPGARPCDVAWIRSLVEQCRAAGVPTFVKQDSGPKPGRQGRIPDDLWVKEFPRVP